MPNRLHLYYGVGYTDFIPTASVLRFRRVLEKKRVGNCAPCIAIPLDVVWLLDCNSGLGAAFVTRLTLDQDRLWVNEFQKAEVRFRKASYPRGRNAQASKSRSLGQPPCAIKGLRKALASPQICRR